MPGPKSTLNCLEARKQLLLVESELNRAEWCNDLSALKQEVCDVMEGGSSFIKTAGFLLAGFRAVRSFWTDRKKGMDDEEHPGIFSLLFRLINTGASIWRKQHAGKD